MDGQRSGRGEQGGAEHEQDRERAGAHPERGQLLRQATEKHGQQERDDQDREQEEVFRKFIAQAVLEGQIDSKKEGGACKDRNDLRGAKSSEARDKKRLGSVDQAAEQIDAQKIKVLGQNQIPAGVGQGAEPGSGLWIHGLLLKSLQQGKEDGEKGHYREA